MEINNADTTTVGYNFNLEDEIPAEYKCLVCHLYIRNAIELPCSHAFCDLCLTRWEQRKVEADENKPNHCLLCKKEYQTEDKHPSKILDRIITTSLDVPCCQKTAGCDWNGKIIDYQDHSNLCQFLKVLCTKEGCMEMKQRRLLKQHEAECDFRLVICKFCTELQKHKDITEHVGFCPEMTINCTNRRCDVKVKRKQMESHHQTECLYQIVTCKYLQVGCIKQMARKDMKDHDNMFNTIHTELLLKGFIDSSTKLHQTQEELVQTKEKLDQTKGQLDQTKGQLDQTKKEIYQNQEYVEGLIYNFCSMLKQIQVSQQLPIIPAAYLGQPLQRQEPITDKMGFFETLPLLSEDNYRAFFNDQVFSFVHSKNLFNFESIGKMHPNLFEYNYKRIFKWLLETMEAGEIYDPKNGDFYFKVPIVKQDKENFGILEVNNLESGKVGNAALLVFGSQNIGLFCEARRHILMYKINPHNNIDKVCLCGSANINDLIWLEQGFTANNNVDWKNHVTDSNEVLFRMVKKNTQVNIKVRRTGGPPSDPLFRWISSRHKDAF